MTGMFISWTRANGRTADLARELDLDARFVFSAGPFGLPGRYARQWRATRSILRAERPDALVLMLPPAPALLALTGALPAGTPLLADLHTGFFLDPKWGWAAGACLRSIRKRGGTAIVTNAHLRAVCERAGVRAVILHDLLIARDPLPAAGYLLCPVSYANDEPIEQILGAAALTPDVEWRLTGRAPQRIRDRAPANVRFTGLLDDESYDGMLRRSAGVVALTTRPHTMQRAGYEAFNAGVPVLTSDFPELRDFHAGSARYARPRAADIARAARELLLRRDELAEELLELRARRIAEQREALELIRDEIGRRQGSPGRESEPPPPPATGFSTASGEGS